MSLYKDPVDTIFKTAEKQNKVTLVRADYIMGDPVAYIDPNGVTNTEITLTARSNATAYEGAATLYYRRLDLADLAKFLPTPILAHGVATVADAAAALNTYYGLNFIVGDLVQGAVSLTNDVGEVTLTATDTSKGWIGTVTLQFARGNIPIDSAVTNKVLDGVLYPNRDETKSFGEMYSYWRDFTDETVTLEGITTATTDFTALATMLTRVTKDTWQPSIASRFSLLGASVTYNGLTSGALRSNQTRGYVCIIQLGVGSLGLSGELMLHYGLPPLG